MLGDFCDGDFKKSRRTQSKSDQQKSAAHGSASGATPHKPDTLQTIHKQDTIKTQHSTIASTASEAEARHTNQHLTNKSIITNFSTKTELCGVFRRAPFRRYEARPASRERPEGARWQCYAGGIRFSRTARPQPSESRGAKRRASQPPTNTAREAHLSGVWGRSGSAREEKRSHGARGREWGERSLRNEPPNGGGQGREEERRTAKRTLDSQPRSRERRARRAPLGSGRAVELCGTARPRGKIAIGVEQRSQWQCGGK